MSTQKSRAEMALSFYNDALRVLREAAADAPRLVVDRFAEDEDGETVTVMRCPVCNGQVIDGEQVVAVDIAERWSYNEQPDFEGDTLTFDISEGDSNITYDDTVYYSHGDPDSAGSHIIALPEGWTEDWS